MLADDLRRIAADIRAGFLPRTADAETLDRAAADLSLLWSQMLQVMADQSRGDGANA